MSGRDTEDRAEADARFELTHFAWGAPDRLELAGRFVGRSAPPPDTAVLIIAGAEHTHRLPAAPDGAAGPAEDGGTWRADFVWQEPPEVFETARLEVGDDIEIELPAPGAAQPQSLPVRRPTERQGDAPAPARTAPAAGAEPLRLESELLATQQEAVELRVALERTREELARARADLGAEREGRAADAERFRQGLAQVRGSAEEALSEAVRQRDAEVTEVREQLTAALAAATEAEAAAAEAQALRKRIERLENARAAAAEAQADAEHLLSRMAAIGDALGGRN